MTAALTVTQAPDGRGYLWGLRDAAPSIFPDPQTAYRAMRAAERMSDVAALTALSELPPEYLGSVVSSPSNGGA